MKCEICGSDLRRPYWVSVSSRAYEAMQREADRRGISVSKLVWLALPPELRGPSLCVLSLPEEVAARVAEIADASGLSRSRALEAIIEDGLDRAGWP